MGFGTVSTAEFFRIPVIGFLRRRTIAGDLPSSPFLPFIKEGRFRQEQTKIDRVDPMAGSGEVPGWFFSEDPSRNDHGTEGGVPGNLPGKLRPGKIPFRLW